MPKEMKPSECPKCKRGGTRTIPRIDELQPLFKKECSDIGKQIDEDETLDWYSLTIGWAIAKGLTPGDAISFAHHVRYHTDLG